MEFWGRRGRTRKKRLFSGQKVWLMQNWSTSAISKMPCWQLSLVIWMLPVVPVENSLEGAVTVVMDLLLHLKVAITGEVNLPIRLCLVGRGEGEIKVVLSHPQPLAQCRQYLKKNFPQAEIRTTGSTSHAARLAQEFPEMAAVAEAGTAKKYGLQILASEIQDASENVTRFIVAGRTIPEATGRDKTSLVIYLERDRPGALFSILQEFAMRR